VRRQKEYEEIKTSTEAALRAAERLRQATESAATKSAVTESAKESSAGKSLPDKGPASPSLNRDPASAVETPLPPAADKKASNPSAAKSQAAGNPGSKSPAAWTQLRAGMSTAAVTALLGPPTATTQDRTLLYWHYGSGASAGRIAFLNGSGQLVAWQPPAR
jgi:hypothetical protein